MKFAIFADAHCGDKIKFEGQRTCPLSYKKIETILKESIDCDFIVNMGDIIDGTGNIEKDKEIFDKVKAILDGYNIINVIGNHDAFSLPKDLFCEVDKDIGGAFSFIKEGIKFIFLDADFYSDFTPYNNNNKDWTDSAIPCEEQKWLEHELDSCNNAIVFCHQNLDTRKWITDGLDPVEVERIIKITHGLDPHCIKNSDDVREILEKSRKVKYVFQGHFHDGLINEINGINYLTLPALCSFNDIVFWKVSIENDVNIEKIHLTLDEKLSI